MTTGITAIDFWVLPANMVVELLFLPENAAGGVDGVFTGNLYLFLEGMTSFDRLQSSLQKRRVPPQGTIRFRSREAVVAAMKAKTERKGVRERTANRQARSPALKIALQIVEEFVSAISAVSDLTQALRVLTAEELRLAMRAIEDHYDNVDAKKIPPTLVQMLEEIIPRLKPEDRLPVLFFFVSHRDNVGSSTRSAIEDVAVAVAHTLPQKDLLAFCLLLQLENLDYNNTPDPNGSVFRGTSNREILRKIVGLLEPNAKIRAESVAVLNDPRISRRTKQKEVVSLVYSYGRRLSFDSMQSLIQAGWWLVRGGQKHIGSQLQTAANRLNFK